MPRQGPRKPMVGFKLDQDTIDKVDRRAEAEELRGPKGEPNRSEWVRLAIAYAFANMPAGWRPPQPEEAQ